MKQVRSRQSLVLAFAFGPCIGMLWVSDNVREYCDEQSDVDSSAKRHGARNSVALQGNLIAGVKILTIYSQYSQSIAMGYNGMPHILIGLQTCSEPYNHYKLQNYFVHRD